MGNHFIHRFYPHFKLQVKNNPTYLEDVRVWFMGNNQSLPMFPRLFSHRQRDILDLVAPAQTSEHSVQLPPESSQWKNHSSHLGICIPPSPSKFHLGKNLQNCRA